jgi:phosphate transport system substrate-binding protein
MLKRGALALAMMATVTAGAAMPAFAQDTDLASLTGSIESDGSSTVGPITQAVAEEFNAAAPDVEIAVAVSGTGGGFERFCAGETDVQNASRPIEDDEVALCAENGVDYYEFEVAFDGLTVVVNEGNTFLDCLNTEALRLLWQEESPATTWAELNAEFPADTIALYGPGTDSGTFDYFVETILGEDGAIRQDFSPSEDDEVIVNNVANDVNGLGYFGYAFFAENEDTLNAVAVDGGAGCVAPSPETIRDGSYAPLSRPLYVYIKAESLERPEVQEFMRFYIENAGTLVESVGFVASPDDVYAADSTKLEDAVSGAAAPDGPAGADEAEATPAS